jgi:hypothetical protein
MYVVAWSPWAAGYSAPVGKTMLRSVEKACMPPPSQGVLVGSTVYSDSRGETVKFERKIGDWCR